MTDMLDRVAAAIAEQQGVHLEMLPSFREAWREKAKSVILAMREPTEAMCDMALVRPEEYIEANDGRRIALTKPRDIWKTMIDEASKEG